MLFAEIEMRSAEKSFSSICPEIISRNEFADYCEANVRTVTSWIESSSLNIKKNHHKDRIGQLGALVAFLQEELSFSSEEVRYFLTTPHIDTETLESHTMLNLLKEPDGMPLVASYAIQYSVD